MSPYPGTTIRSVRIDDPLWTAIQQQADEEEVSASELIRRVLDQYIRQGAAMSQHATHLEAQLTEDTIELMEVDPAGEIGTVHSIPVAEDADEDVRLEEAAAKLAAIGWTLDRGSRSEGHEAGPIYTVTRTA